MIYNAVNLNEFYPIEKNSKKTDLSLVSVEGTVQGELAINILKSISVAGIDVYGQIHKKILNDKVITIVNILFRHNAMNRSINLKSSTSESDS